MMGTREILEIVLWVVLITNTIWVLAIRDWIKQALDGERIGRELRKAEEEYPFKKISCKQVLVESFERLKMGCKVCAVLTGIFCIPAIVGYLIFD
jgi:hypothetical protein